MTVCVAVAVNDCIVFAADSASSLVQTGASGASTVVNVYAHGNKVFNLHKRLPVCAMTCGMGNIGNASIGALTKDLRLLLTSGDGEWRLDRSTYTIEEIAVKARRFFFEDKFLALQPPPPPPHSMEFWIAGYSGKGSGVIGHQVWKLAIINGACDPPVRLVDNGGTGIFVGGQITAINRLIVGVDQRINGALLQAGMPEPAASALADHIRSQFEAQLLSPMMPIQDAIDLADFLVETTKRYFRFLPGADIVGGETDIAVVTKHEGFKWIKRKHYYSPHLNPLETDHA